LTKFTHLILSLLYRGYQERQDKGEEQKQLSKECTWLVQNGFQGLEGQQIPDMTEEYIEKWERYIELYEKSLGEVRESRHFKYQ
jgi:phosphoribosylaminoimidazole-succinocarboxamide synthase